MPHSLGTTADALTQAVRPIRPVRGGVDAPWDGMLVAVAGEERRLFVSTEALPTQWHGWAADPDGHLMGALDVARRPDGHDAILPACSERVTEFIARRRSAGADLSDGERVTLAISVLRAAAELSDAAKDSAGPIQQPQGEWWITDDGKPLLATAVGSQGAFDACNEVLTLIAHQHDHRWARGTEAVSPATRPYEFEEREAQVFAIANPCALASSPLTPVNYAADAPPDAPAPAAHRAPPDPPTSLLHRFLRHIDNDVADAVSRATTAVWRAGARPTARRAGAPWLVAAVVALVIVGVGWLWPEPAPLAQAEGLDEPTVEPAVDHVDADASTGSKASPSGADPGTDLVAEAEALVRAFLACEEDERCRDAVSTRQGLAIPRGSTLTGSAREDLVVVDDFGGVAVLRADAAGDDQAAQIVVIERTDEKWLLRDVYDAAQQP
ncbi:hypothetical protein [Microbacterium sp. C7(2022)]|uniref:hypothetical protein n=1 Tax=Microbacterium sp. C7(2022) TaxID=2992759 RepID=UPI00237B28C5|nr:hypothetical protein [Microbacterium sp. C7(2022)]MDE0545456.1 hypothetical protein [Microbacterium sp. C7(2022)]